MNRGIAALSFAVAVVAFGMPAGAAETSSEYLELASEVAVTGGSQVVLTTTISISAPAGDDVLLEADGSYFPTVPGVAGVFVSVDGTKVSNDAFVDWTMSSDPRLHSFNVVGTVHLAAGSHVVSLMGEALSGSFKVSPQSNLGVMVRPASQVIRASLSTDTGPFDFTTVGIVPGTPVPHTPLISTAIDPAGEDVIALASGRSFYNGGYGDAMFGLYLDGQSLGNAESLWTVNDTWTGAELQAPLFTHAFYPALSGSHTISLDASEFPWDATGPNGGEDSVLYNAGGGSTVVALAGEMTVRGKASASSASDDCWDWVCIGSDQGFTICPTIGTPKRLAAATIEIPTGHDGVVMFLAKSRVQGDGADSGGTASLYLTIDGIRVGSTGFQPCAFPNCVSQRTIGASYLAAGANALSPGTHKVEAWGQVESGDSYAHLMMVKDLPLVWFDGPQTGYVPGSGFAAKPAGCSCSLGASDTGSMTLPLALAGLGLLGIWSRVRRDTIDP